ncbi:MAG: hypothetical protein JO192_02940 [Candidatus Eremiobacteraeota bacterium]|nr:hypothetical protein [Candidatus Eremiobacteraeota bacterium]MBV8721773.1 hypothetical protein [Candidatus Eremiobacteraeota bacterium]
MYVQPLESQLATLAPMANELENPLASLESGLAPAFAGGDGISRFAPPLANGVAMESPMQTAMFGPLAGLIQQLMAMLQSMMGYGSSAGGACPGYGNGCEPYGGEQFFPNAAGASTGDPHLSFNGSHWNSMASQPDLLDSNSIPGGFHIATQVSSPTARGITWNQSATVSLNGGQTTISLDNAGQPSIENFGQNVPIADGQTIDLGNGASVTRNSNGSLSVVAQNGYGGRIATTLNAQGQGVNVEVSAQNVDLGGSLVAGNGQTPIDGSPSFPPVSEPIGGPVFDPIPPIGGWPPPLEPPMSGTPVIGAPPFMGGSPVTLPHPPIRMIPN